MIWKEQDVNLVNTTYSLYVSDMLAPFVVHCQGFVSPIALCGRLSMFSELDPFPPIAACLRYVSNSCHEFVSWHSWGRCSSRMFLFSHKLTLFDDESLCDQRTLSKRYSWIEDMIMGVPCTHEWSSPNK